ncbi:MAG TPA: DNA primase [Gemmatimonadota bacterium]|nr:DNA primase [Gemmatimonadota bacterium]
MSIPDHVIEEIRDRTEIVEVIGEVVPLKKRGKNWVGLCPFHPEKTPSFTVTPEKQMYYCFGCQAGGNVFTFLMEHERLEFPDAVRTLGERAGVEVPEREAASGPDPHAPIHFANRLAAEFYQRRLLEAEDAEAARDYLHGRGVGRELWEEFLLGWAPESWDALIEEAARHDVGPEDLLAAGLVGRSEKTGGLFDRFRGRVMFPIRGVGGKVVAFSGRRLDAEEPKYLNTADTPVFAKGRMLFNLDRARTAIRRTGAAVIVEGNFDVVSLAGAGFQNVVAALGTSFTDEQCRVLRRYTSTAYLAYDGDAAGQRSAFKAGDLLLGAGFAVRLVDLPAGQDPASLVQAGGAGAFHDRLEKSEDVIDAKLRIVREKVDLSDVHRKRRAIQRLLESVARVPDPVTRELYAGKVARELDVPRETLALPAAAAPAGGRPAPARRERPARPRGPSTPAGIALPESQDEWYALLHAVSEPRWLEQVIDGCRPEYFTVPVYEQFFRRLADLRAEGVREIGEHVATGGDPEMLGVLARLEALRGEVEKGFELSDKALRESLQRIHEDALERGVHERRVEPTGDVLEDMVERQRVRREIAPGRFGTRRPRG